MSSNVKKINGFVYETNPVLPNWFQVHNPNHKYCNIAKSGDRLYINTTGTNLGPVEAKKFLEEFIACQEAIEFFQKNV